MSDLFSNRGFRRLIVLAFGLTLWLLPVPWGLEARAWQLFAVFSTVILAVLINAASILSAAILGLVVAVFTGVLSPEQAYSGFSKNFILLILVAFIVSKGMVKSGLGRRLAFLLIRRFGHSTLNLGYCIAVTDALIAPAFPSNTARSGVLYPIAYSLAVDTQSRVEDGTGRRTGSYLMMVGIASLCISSGLWLTAMAVNPVGVEIAAGLGVSIGFGSWLLASSVPSLLALAAVPYVLYRLFPPEMKRTPEAPGIATRELRLMGPMSRNEWIMAATFLLMIALWALAGRVEIDSAAVAFLGLALILLSGVYTPADLRNEGGDALETFVWFAIMYTLSNYLNEFGFMSTLGDRIASGLTGLSWPLAYVCIIAAYILIHYLFVSQTAHLFALFAVFLSIALNSGVPGHLAAFGLLFATNYFAAITPQGSSANILFAGSGYLSQGDIYRYGGLITLTCFLIYITAGSLWVLLWF